MKQYRLFTLGSFLLLIPLGLAVKFYRGTGQEWLNNSFGGIPYELFWITLAAFIFPRVAAAKIAIWVFIITAIFECLQLWHPPFLQAIRSTVMGRLIIGTTFAWGDFIYYVIGCILGWLYLEFLKKKCWG